MKILNTGRANGMTSVVAVTIAITYALSLGLVRGVHAIIASRKKDR